MIGGGDPFYLKF